MKEVINTFICKISHDLLSKQFLNFILAGLCSASVSIVSRIVFQLEFSYFISVFLASVAGMIINFLINRKLVFKNRDENLHSQFLKFLMIGSVSLILTPISATLLLNSYTATNVTWISYPMAELLAHMGALIMNSLYGFFAIKYFVFRAL
jgi:putative flippase GtrA